jgi:hypothetical protein
VAIAGELTTTRACPQFSRDGREGDQVLCCQERSGGREQAVPFGDDASEYPAEQVAGSFAFDADFIDGPDFRVVLEPLEHAGKQQVVEPDVLSSPKSLGSRLLSASLTDSRDHGPGLARSPGSELWALIPGPWRINDPSTHSTLQRGG